MNKNKILSMLVCVFALLLLAGFAQADVEVTADELTDEKIVVDVDYNNDGWTGDTKDYDVTLTLTNNGDDRTIYP